MKRIFAYCVSVVANPGFLSGALFCMVCVYVIRYTVDLKALVANNSFGKTHFIVGYSGANIPSEQKQKQKQYPKNETGESWLQQLLQKRGSVVLFSPDDDMHELIVTLIDQEKSAIKMAIFTFTDAIIAQALKRAHTRGVKVEIVTDKGSILDSYNKIDELYKAGITIYVYNPGHSGKKRTGIMHHKFIIFQNNKEGKGFVLTGSYNFTRSARFHNQENVIVLNRKRVVRRFDTQFEILCKRSELYRPLFVT